MEPTPPYGKAVPAPVPVQSQPVAVPLSEPLAIPSLSVSVGETCPSPLQQRRSPLPPSTVTPQHTVTHPPAVTEPLPLAEEDSLNGDSLDTPMHPTHLRYVYRPLQPDIAPSYASSVSGSPMHTSIHDEAHRRKLNGMAHHSFW